MSKLRLLTNENKRLREAVHITNQALADQRIRIRALEQQLNQGSAQADRNPDKYRPRLQWALEEVTRFEMETAKRRLDDIKLCDSMRLVIRRLLKEAEKL